MSKKFLVMGILLFLVSILWAAEDPGKVLLDRLTLMFKQMADTGCGGETAIMEELDKLMAEAKKVRDQKQVDAVFFRRYHRMLMVTRLMCTPDKEGVLAPLINDEITRFTEDVNGNRARPELGEIAAIADAMANEILNLHLYPETVKMRTKMRKDFDKKFSDGK